MKAIAAIIRSWTTTTTPTFAGIAIGKVIKPPRPERKPLVAAFVTCQRIRELTWSTKGASSSM